MSDALTILLGPLAVPECARVSRRGWLIWVRMLPALAAGVVTFIVVWIWWIGLRFDRSHQPFFEIRTGLTIVEGMLIACSMLLAPAFLAGSLAGEKERGSIGLLLTTRVNAAEIVLGRLAAGLSQILMIELASLPALLLLDWLAGLNFFSTLTVLALPVGVAFGGAGIALGASAVSRRGRDALLLVYLIDVLFLLSTLSIETSWSWLGLASPFTPIRALCWEELLWPSLVTIGFWLAIGTSGLALAAWRLRPSCLSEGKSERSRKKIRRTSWIPPIDDERPMLWKELYIERVGTLGRAGRWIGGILVLWMGLGSLAVLGYATWGFFVNHDTTMVDQAITWSSNTFGNSAQSISLLILCAVGLRSAVTISSERERGTWDALLTSPLEGGEIIRGKLWGSLYALKWLIGSALLCWTITLVLGGMHWAEYTETLVALAVVAPFLAAVGVRTSLQSATATRAMGVTMGLGLAAYIAAYFIAIFCCMVVMLLCVLYWFLLVYLGLSTFNTPPWFPMSFRLGTDIVLCNIYIVATIMIVGETRLRFDRVAGRMTGGETAVAIDHMIHGVPMAPVPRPKKLAPARKRWKRWQDEIA